MPTRRGSDGRVTSTTNLQPAQNRDLADRRMRDDCVLADAFDAARIRPRLDPAQHTTRIDIHDNDGGFEVRCHQRDPPLRAGTQREGHRRRGGEELAPVHAVLTELAGGKVPTREEPLDLVL